MFGEIFTSTSDFIKTRLTNPFLGTLLAVWFIRNFEFIYALFNFSEGVTLTQKEDYIREYFRVYGTFFHFFQNVGYAVSLLILSFIFLLITRAITNGYAGALNLLNKYTDKGSVVSRAEFETLENHYKTTKSERDQLRTESNLHDSQIKDEKASRQILSDEIVRLTEENSKEKIDLEKWQSQVNKLNGTVAQLGSALDREQSEREQLEMKYSEFDFENTPHPYPTDHLRKMINSEELDENKLIDLLDDYILDKPQLAGLLRLEIQDKLIALYKDHKLTKFYNLINLILRDLIPIENIDKSELDYLISNDFVREVKPRMIEVGKPPVRYLEITFYGSALFNILNSL